MSTTPPLTGFRVLDFSQFVAGPLATMLMADLGADVIKVEGPSGDAYRHYEPLGGGESKRFYSLNRNKRSIVCDLKDPQGREDARRLVSTADAIVHNHPLERAQEFGLTSEQVAEVNPRAVVASISAFGSIGPEAGRFGYDIIAQAFAGLLMADAHPGDKVPRRSGGLPYADITAGLLACISVTASLAGRQTNGIGHAEVSLLGAALTAQLQGLVRLENETPAHRPSSTPPATSQDLHELSQRIIDEDSLEPYYRCYEAADGFFALACLTTTQRQHVLDILDLGDPWVADPQAPPASDKERRERQMISKRFEERFRTRSVDSWLDAFDRRRVPAGAIHQLSSMFDNPQVHANNLVQHVHQQAGGDVELLGSPFSFVSQQPPASRPAPMLDEHRAEIFQELSAIRTSSEDRTTPTHEGASHVH